MKNGRLLAEMVGRFDVLITADRNIYAQQNLAGRPISILVLPTNRRNDVLRLRERLLDIVNAMSLGQYIVVEKTGEVHSRALVGRRSNGTLTPAARWP